jgi:hypothetical protein
MPETIFEYGPIVRGLDGNDYAARACGRQRADATWEGWIEFVHIDGLLVYRTPRETSQPNRTDLVYWATGVSSVYLEGALERAMSPRPVIVETITAPPAFEGPAPELDEIQERTLSAEAVLDPFSVYAKGETVLIRELMAMAPWHLRNIARAYHISDDPVALQALTKTELVQIIVGAARAAAIPVEGPIPR